MTHPAEDAVRILDSLVDSVVVVDDHLVVSWVNPAGARLLGRPASSIIGQSALDLVHEPDRIDAADRLATLLGGLQPAPVSLRLVREDGSLIWVEVFGGPLATADGRPHLLLSLRDVGWRKAVELGSLREVGRLGLLVDIATRFLGLPAGRLDEVLDQVLADIGQVLDATTVALHDVSSAGDRVTARSRWVRRGPAGAAVAGPSVPVGEPVAVERVSRWLASVSGRDGAVEAAAGSPEHEDLARIEPIDAGSAVSVALRTGERLGGVLTVGWAASTPVPAEIRAFVERTGALLGMASVRERARAELVEREAFFRDLFEDNSAVMYLVDPGTLIVEDANAAAADFYGYSRDRLRGMELHELTVHDRDALRRMIAGVHMDGAVVITERQRLASGEERDVEIRSTRIRVGDHDLDLAIVTDVTDKRRAEAELRRLADTDDLTGALDRRRFLEVAEEEIGRARRHDRPLSLLMIDLDHFKAINDRFGHRVGDEALVRFVATCRPVLRAHDRLGRLGGEEFAALLPETDVDGAVRLAERLLEVVREIVLPDAPDVHLTASVGAAELGPDTSPDDTVDDLLRVADRRLYGAKSGGRDRVVGTDG